MSRLTIGQRLAAGFSLVLLLAVVIAGISLWRLQDSAEETRAMMAEPLAKERLVSDWYANVNAGVRRTAAIARSADPSLVAFFADDVAAASKASSRYQDEIKALMAGDREKAVFADISDARKRFVGARDRITALKKDGLMDEAQALLDSEFKPAAKAYLEGMQALQRLQREDLDARSQQIDALNRASARWLMALSGLAILLGAVASWQITRSISEPLHRAVEAARRVADGDLSHRVVCDRSDEVGHLLRALHDMQHRLSEVVARVRGNADSVANASISGKKRSR